MKLFDLEEQFAFYGAYHSNIINVIIHCVFVWPILFTFLVFCSYSSPLFSTPLPFGPFPGHELVVFNLAFFVAAFYGSYYVLLDRKGGWVGAACALACWIGAQGFLVHFGASLAWKIALALHVTSWVSQFVGHGAFEGRAPALLDNLAQALMMAPYFVILELLVTVFHYEPSPGFSARVRARVDHDIEVFRERKKKKVASFQD
eukprot:TRINITY_DN35966_c0_g1_i1.p1 TRINITY_DN35966_c0_g1~~TRINITY_DN35966_c0_g1_i1.p1  ORF type:complete len:203 (-),score=16.48 TRINITY_DN35966_c0_g1_i1:1018-1626(-)